MKAIKEIKKDLKKAIINKDDLQKKTIRSLLNLINTHLKINDNKITEEEILLLIRKEVKETKQQLTFAIKSRRIDIIEDCNKRLEILDSYIPSQMTDEEIQNIIYGLMSKFGMQSISNKDRGRLIKEALKFAQGKADGPRINGEISKIIRIKRRA